MALKLNMNNPVSGNIQSIIEYSNYFTCSLKITWEIGFFYIQRERLLRRYIIQIRKFTQNK